ncbi:MAG: hypothetical protein AAF411_18970 [Myxococcota bacterium]
MRDDPRLPPRAWIDALPPDALESLKRWWSTLGDARRNELHHLCDRRHDDIALAASGELWQSLPIRLQGRTVEDRELGAEGRQMKRDLLEFILNREEIVFFLEERRFHICRHHSQARAALERGAIPADFRCSLRGEACPMRAVSKAAGQRPVLIELRIGSRQIDR